VTKTFLSENCPKYFWTQNDQNTSGQKLSKTFLDIKCPDIDSHSWWLHNDFQHYIMTTTVLHCCFFVSWVLIQTVFSFIFPEIYQSTLFLLLSRLLPSNCALYCFLLPKSWQFSGAVFLSPFCFSDFAYVTFNISLWILVNDKYTC